MQKLYTIIVLSVVLFLAGSNGILAQEISLHYLDSFETGLFDEAAAEIVAYCPAAQKLFFTNADNESIGILDFSDPHNLSLVKYVDMAQYNGSPNSVAVKMGVVAVALEDDDAQANGRILFFDTDGTYLTETTAGAMPDMVTFSPDGQFVITANEGEPNDEYNVDPFGSVTIAEVTLGMGTVTINSTTTLDFQSITTVDESTRIFGPNASIAQDLEPEYVGVTPDSKYAFVTLQENNAVAKIDLEAKTIEWVKGLGFKDHSLEANYMDSSNKDDMINIAGWPVLGMYQPDAIAAFMNGDSYYFATANEGDARDYDGYSEEERVKDLTLDPTVFGDVDELQKDENLGRLNTTTALADTNAQGEYKTIYSYGARSFSIFDQDGNLVFDSGKEFEEITAAAYPDDFNSNNDENDSFDARSDDKGPEPEAITIGSINNKMYAFVGLERIGGVMIYDITDPAAPVFKQYINHRDFSGDLEAGTGGDSGPESIVFIPAAQSPNGYNLLVVANEITGTVSSYIVAVDGVIPVELTAFTAELMNDFVVLQWSTATETNNKGFEIEKSLDNKDFAVVAYIQGRGNSSETVAYSYNDYNVTSGTAYYRLKQIDFDGTYEYSNVIEVSKDIPVAYALDQNYPNPFNPITTISFQVAEQVHVKLRVFNVLGNEIATLVDGVKNSGRYDVTFDGTGLASGTYFYTLEASNFISTRKLMLVK